MQGPAARRESDEPTADFTRERVFIPPQVPFWFRPWVEMFKAFGLPTTLIAFYLLQNAGVIPSETQKVNEMLRDHDVASRAASAARLDVDRQRLEIDRAHIEALNGLRQELRKNNRITRAMCAEWGKLPDIRKACLEE